jgi:hypothetical protein
MQNIYYVWIADVFRSISFNNVLEANQYMQGLIDIGFNNVWMEKI